MNCMKCGANIDDDRVFCESCLRGMDAYPVKPGTVVLLPKRGEQPPVKKVYAKRRTPPSLEEQNAQLKKRLRLVTALLVLALALLSLLVYPTAVHLLERQDVLPGQNYSAMTTPEPEPTE